MSAAEQGKPMSEWCEQTSLKTSEWPSTSVSFLSCSGPLCMGAIRSWENKEVVGGGELKERSTELVMYDKGILLLIHR